MFGGLYKKTEYVLGEREVMDPYSVLGVSRSASEAI